MYLDLHTMRLVLPGKPRAIFRAIGNGSISEYVWPCGCRGSGVDDAALEVLCCSPHSDLLASAQFSRRDKE